MSHFFTEVLGQGLEAYLYIHLPVLDIRRGMNRSGTIHLTHFKHGKIYDPVNAQTCQCCIGVVDVMLKPGTCRFFFGQWEYPDTRP